MTYRPGSGCHACMRPNHQCCGLGLVQAKLNHHTTPYHDHFQAPIDHLPVKWYSCLDHRLLSHGVVSATEYAPPAPRRPLRILLVRQLRGAAGGRADAPKGPPRRAPALRRRLEHQRPALHRLGGLQRGTGVRHRGRLVRRLRVGGARGLLLPVLPRQPHQGRRLLLLAQDLRRIPPPPPRLHCHRHHRVRGAVRRAGQAGRQHVGDAAVRGAPVGRRGGEPAGVRRVHRDGQGIRRRRHGRRPAARPRGQGRPGGEPGGRRGRRARLAHRQQRAQDQDRARHHKEDPDRRRSRDAGAGVPGPRVLVGWAELSCSLPSVSGMDPCCRHIYIGWCFPSPAQRGGRHLRGHGGMGAPPAGQQQQHRPGRHPTVRRRGDDLGGAAPEQGGEPPVGDHAQRRARQRLQRQHLPAGSQAASQLQPVRPAGAAPLQPLPRRPVRPPLRRRRGAGRLRAAGVAGPRVPGGGRAGTGGVRDARAADAVDVRAGAGGRQRQRRAGRVRAGAGGAGGLHVRAADVRGGGRGQLPRAAAAQRQGVPGAGGGGGGGGGGRGGVGGAHQGEAAAARGRAVPGVAVPAPHRGQVSAQEPPAAVPASRERRAHRQRWLVIRRSVHRDR